MRRAAALRHLKLDMPSIFGSVFRRVFLVQQCDFHTQFFNQPKSVSANRDRQFNIVTKQRATRLMNTTFGFQSTVKSIKSASCLR